MDHLAVEQRPDLRRPIVVAAFTGWNDAGDAASDAARFFVRRLGARRFAYIRPDYFYNFIEERPNVRFDGTSGERRVSWRRTEFFFARNPTGEHDYIIVIGPEPHLRWRTFTDIFADLFADLGVETVVTLGALISEVSHHQPTRIFAGSEDAELAELLDATPPTNDGGYQGPTGIVSVIGESLREAGHRTASIWASVPHYITTSSNPAATLAILERLQGAIDIDLDTSDLSSASERFMGEVDAALDADDDLREYVSNLDQRTEELAAQEEAAEDLPEATDLVVDIEDFLRRGQSEDEANDQ